MPIELPGALIREGFVLLLQTGGPIFFGLLAVGLVVGVLQAATQVNDPALSFLPRLFTLGAILWGLGSWAAQAHAQFFAASLARMAGG